MTTTSFNKHVDLVGLKFGRLTVTGFLGTLPTGTKAGNRPCYLCLCECGNEVKAWKGQLVRGLKRSCGCLFKEVLDQRNTTHGKSKSKEFKIWQGVISRCELKKATGYNRYGGAGIEVCPEWRRSFEAFLSDMGPAPTRDHSLDRIDNTKGYSKENCRWATWKQQSYNSKRTRLITLEGVTANLSDWGRASGVNSVIGDRLKRGWAVERAILTPPGGKEMGINIDEVLARVLEITEGIDIPRKQ